MTKYRHQAKFDENSLAVLDIESISGEDMPEGGFPPWCTHSPVVCSVLTADRDRHDVWAFALKSIRFSEDEDPLGKIEALLKGRSCVTFNGRGFDLPVLSLTAQKTRQFGLTALIAAATEPRFDSGQHYDLADHISGFGQARGASLELLCRELDIPAKADTHGNQVGALYDQGKIHDIVAYCETDVAATLQLFAHRYGFERGDEYYFASLTYQFARWIRQTGIDHLQPFAEIDELDVLLGCSLSGQINVARANAKVDADRQEQRRIDASFCDPVHY